ncbi:MAG: 16S rRNA (cytidine(1402)-2'-O)-methyltransferase [Firmicutes bacterium HGW-Firmicutes-8]|nr:MAG: 16S rRNA (cytidine(1402)-2'-O)-methyltransferase [Firmicutes bacterium HGW-Firmicutes-8]
MNEDAKPGSLYLCATPIGNLEDVTLRALRIMREVSLIAAEDTRHTRKLLSRYDIHTPLTSYHEHNKREKGPKLVAQLKEGKDIALVSDAGTPGISDPGQELVLLAVEEGLTVIPVPGASAVIAALTSSGLSTGRFAFEGFLPRVRKERNKVLNQIVAEERTFVFYESPQRIMKTLQEILTFAGDRNIVVARELTKVHEEILRGQISQIIEHFRGHSPKGEFTVVLDGRNDKTKELPIRSSSDLYKMVTGYLVQGFDKKGAIKETARTIGISKKEVYSAVLEVENK